MYSYEITKFLEERNYKISNKDFFMLSDPTISPQIIGCEYKNPMHYLWTNDGYNWGFQVYREPEPEPENENDNKKEGENEE